jgi:hypothetical protein
MLRIARRDIVSRIPILSQIKAYLTQNWNNLPFRPLISNLHETWADVFSRRSFGKP